METITSVNNKTVKRLVLLRDKSRERREAQRFIIEGVRAVADVDASYVETVYVTEELYQEMTCGLEPVTQWGRDLQKILYYYYVNRMTLVSEDVMRKISGTSTPQGVLAAARMPQHTLAEILDQTENPLLLMCEDIQDPGNLGTMIRTAEAAGVSGIVLSKDCADLYNPKVVRATMSAIFRVPVVAVSDFAEAMRMTREHGVRIYAAYLDPEGTTDYDGQHYTAGTAFLIGNEGNGLRKETAEAADVRIRIPMAGQIESLNAAMSAGILMYEAARQRRHEM